ncbi:putative uncharacterized protein DDB_G0282133 [Halyomorpha halys]|uniref:putative uncharacterized protein DDB_G0282133 n=1 Tax=Halyomorpha halys TaxID=286706 RepID=UPI0006D4E862|nr:putative uncharacterized protein DDB_G0282133 [Halyomorpha halys]
MQNVKKEKVNSISEILEEIVRCVTAPSFCVMPWKCVTMAVGDRMDPLVKKSVVHIYRTCVDGQNIFQIKVHNCKKEVCDHAICTKDCETNRQTNAQAGKEALQYEINKRRRKKRNKFSEGNKETTIGCCLLNMPQDEKHIRIKKHKDNNDCNARIQNNKRIIKKNENKEKPSCTLQIFADGKSRKLNFQLHPAMKVFLGKALDRIEGHDVKGRRTNSPTHRTPDTCEDILGKCNTFKSKISKTMKKSLANSQCCNKNLLTESVEEFEINLPDNTGHTKDCMNDLGSQHSLTDISIKSCNCENNPIPHNVGKNIINPEFKMNAGYLLDKIIPVQQPRDGKGKGEKETLEKCQNEQLTTDNTHQKTTTGPLSQTHHERGIKYNYNEGGLMGYEERFHLPPSYHQTFQDHQADYHTSKHGNNEMNSKVKPNPTNSSWNICYGNENNPQSYANASRCIQNRPRDNIIRTPYIVDYHNDNNEILVNDVRNINNRNCLVSDNRASMHSADYINNATIHKSNIGMYSPPNVHEAFSMPPEYRTFLTNDGVYNNKFHETQQYHNYPNHEADCMNMRNENIDHETQILHEQRENRKECRRFNSLANTRYNNLYPESQKRMFFQDASKPEYRQLLEDVPTSDRSHNNTTDRMRNANDFVGPIRNDLQEKSTYVRTKYIGLSPDIATNQRSKFIKRKYCKESEKLNSNSDYRKPNNSTAGQYVSCSLIESKTSNKQNITTISNIEQNTTDSSGQQENKRFIRTAENDTHKAFLLKKAYEMPKNAGPSTHSNYKLINKPRIKHENEEQFYERHKFIHVKPSRIASEENVKKRLKRNKRKHKTENSNITKENTVYLRKTPKESYIVMRRTQSTETTDSSIYMPQEVCIDETSEKSSDILSFCYPLPGEYSTYQLLKHNRNKNRREHLSREKTHDTNDGVNEYDTDSKFFCYPSQISWDHYENLHQIIPNIHQRHYIKVKNSRSEKKVEPIKNITNEGESLKLCYACSKPLNEGKVGEKCMENSFVNKYETRDSCSKNLEMNDSQYKFVTNLEESYHSSKNDNVACNLTNLNLNDIRNTANHSNNNPTIDTNQICHSNKVEARDVKNNMVRSKDHNEQNATMKCENLQKQSKMLHSQSVMKFFSHAKEYFRKYSTSSIRSGLSNGVLQAGPSNSSPHSVGPENKVESHPCGDSKHLAEVSGNKRNNNTCNVNKMQCNNPGTRACSVNNNDVGEIGDTLGRFNSKPQPTQVFRNNSMLVYTNPGTKFFKPGTYAHSQVNLKDEKYRLYESNEMTMDRWSSENNNFNFLKNEFKIIESESECEGFSDDMYSYSSSEWQGKVAKNWVASTRKKHIKHDHRINISLKNNNSESIYSLQTDFSNRKVQKEEKCDNKPMINATIALSPDKKKRVKKKLEVEDKFQANQFSKKKSDHKFSNLFSNSIKNNYKKIKGLVKRTQTQQKKRSHTRVPIIKSPSFTETQQSQSFLTPATSTYMTNKSCDTTTVTENTAVKFFNESTINNYWSDSNVAKSDPIIRKIEPSIWHKFVARKDSQQSIEISETENVETENSSTSDISIKESSLQVRSSQRIIQHFDRSYGVRNTKNHFSNNGASVNKGVSKFYNTKHPGASEAMDKHDQSDESIINCFENPMVDPKTGFRPSVPT